MLCLGRWDDLGAGGQGYQGGGVPVDIQSGLLATRVACWLPEWPVSY